MSIFRFHRNISVHHAIEFSVLVKNKKELAEILRILYREEKISLNRIILLPYVLDKNIGYYSQIVMLKPKFKNKPTNPVGFLSEDFCACQKKEVKDAG